MSRPAVAPAVASACSSLSALVTLALPRLVNDYLVRVLIVMCINAVLVASMGLANGFTGVFSLGHVGFVAVGAYVSGILSLPVTAKPPTCPTCPAGSPRSACPSCRPPSWRGLICAALAFVVGAPLMRLSGYFVSVATLGFLIIVNVVLINAVDYTRGARTFTGVPLETTLPWAVGWLVVTLVVLARIVYSPIGRRYRAVREDTIAAQAIGIVGAADAAFRLHARRLLRRRRRLALRPLSRLVLAGELLHGLHLRADQHAGDRRHAEPDRRGRRRRCGHRSLSEVLRNLERGIDLGAVRLPPLYGASQIVLGRHLHSRHDLPPERHHGRPRALARAYSARERRNQDRGVAAMKSTTDFQASRVARSRSGLRSLARPRPPADTIKIGAPFNVTGALSSLDAPALNGAKLKAKEINDAGGIDGKQIELVVYDTKTDPTVIASVGEPALNQDKVPVAARLHRFRLGAGARADLPAGRHSLRDARRHLAQAARPGRRHDMFLACFGDNVQAAAGAEFVKAS